MTAASTVNKHSSSLTDHHHHHHHLPSASNLKTVSHIVRLNKVFQSFSDGAGDPELGLGLPRTGKHYHQHSAATGKVENITTERTRLVVFGIMKISRVRLLAMLSGLRLESEIVSLHTSLTYKEKVRQTSPAGTILPQQQASTQLIPRMECSLTGHLGRAMIVLLEVKTT